MLDKIFIKGLALEAIIGIYPHEKTKKQPLLVDLDLYLDTSKSAHSGQITDTVDYDAVAKRVEQIVASSDYDIIESLIQSIVDVILKEFKVDKVKCTLYKPEAITKAETVGITIVREK